MACSRRGFLRNRPVLRASCSPSLTAQRRAAWWWLSPASWGCPCDLLEWERRSETCCPSIRKNLWIRCSNKDCHPGDKEARRGAHLNFLLGDSVVHLLGPRSQCPTKSATNNFCAALSTWHVRVLD